jgi:hypothetical protein
MHLERGNGQGGRGDSWPRSPFALSAGVTVCVRELHAMGTPDKFDAWLRFLKI